MYAGVDGNKVTQGNPPTIKWSPRVGAVYSLNTKTVLRGGYGVFWAPWNSPAPSPATSNYGQVGYTLNTLVPQTAPVPTVSLTNPFPNGVQQPSGNSLGTASGVGLNIAFADQTQHGAARAAVLAGLPARADGESGAPHQLCGRSRRSPGPRREQRHARQHQPARPEVPRARSGLEPDRPEPVLRRPERRSVREPAPRSVARSCCARFRSSPTSTPVT